MFQEHLEVAGGEVLGVRPEQERVDQHERDDGGDDISNREGSVYLWRRASEERNCSRGVARQGRTAVMPSKNTLLTRQPRGTLLLAAKGEDDAQAYRSQATPEDGLIPSHRDVSGLLRERLENESTDLLVEGAS